MFDPYRVSTLNGFFLREIHLKKCSLRLRISQAVRPGTALLRPTKKAPYKGALILYWAGHVS